MNKDLGGKGARKGILGGTFNPPHLAHLIVAHVVREELALDCVLLIPARRHAFKGDLEVNAIHRAAMTELAAAGDPGLKADRIEISRDGTSYTVDTLVELSTREPDTNWHLILGQDNLAELGAWKETERLPELAHIVVTTRGSEVPELPYDGRGTLVPVPALEISSTVIRERVAAGRSIRYWVPPAVEAYVRSHALYGVEPVIGSPVLDGGGMDG